jgi:hypothetical protein
MSDPLQRVPADRGVHMHGADHRPLILTYGGMLLLIGAATVVLAGMDHWTALIPAILGGITLLLALVSRPGRGGIAATVGAVAVAAIALVGTVSAVPLLPAALSGGEGVGNAAAVIARAATAAASALFVALLAIAALRSRPRAAS